MKSISFYLILSFLILALLLAGCSRPPETKVSLTQARQGFTTRLIRHETAREPVPEPPPSLFHIVRYTAPAGSLAAYLSPPPTDGKKHPVILWITGGDCNTIGDVWKEASPDNDQTARAFRDAGILMMFPSLRGGNENPGYKEGFFGEVEDILAAADYLAKQNFVDPNRIYLGGHSTGGSLVLLTAESSNRFRAVFSFGPVEDVTLYGSILGDDFLPFDVSNNKERELRAPGRWLHSIQSPVFVFEGTQPPGNLASLQAMSGSSTNPLVHFHAVRGANHFSILAPTTRLIADKILKDEGSATNLAFTEEELNRPFTP
jgi:acetyl esterase/lipase